MTLLLRDQAYRSLKMGLSFENWPKTFIETCLSQNDINKLLQASSPIKNNYKLMKYIQTYFIKNLILTGY